MKITRVVSIVTYGKNKIDISVIIVYIFDAFDEHHDRRQKR